MTISIAHLGPHGTYAETAALKYLNWFTKSHDQAALLCPYPSITQSLEAVAKEEVQVAVAPIENSIEGSVTMTLDALWRLDTLRIQHAIVLPIHHALLSIASDFSEIQTVYSHPQALAQCQNWLDRNLPSAQVIAANSTTEALQHLGENQTIAAISSQRAAQLYSLPVLASPINDHPENCTRFIVVSLDPSPGGSRTSIAFSVSANQPGVLVKPLQIFAEKGINLSRIESRPTKRSLGDYVFFVDLEADTRQDAIQSALAELEHCTETLKIFGSYDVLPAIG
ncbi:MULTISPECIES: prephenate dehydratase [Leptolyngbya]|uniref:Prephenate dehydratase n=1 Tax=Leptolyngbya boryana CZ1 TaxID=3060204 RepID=A0AA97AN16_LEPBY|nr:MULTISPECIES: prephenate dehydratase [Leptolyngbya]MCY6491990.1 prephenate dehydratase [Leptolyngbya sp. GGD]WNZ44632.1 prephenate dehydratase [Leptolyngbya boryana CZ1]